MKIDTLILSGGGPSGIAYFGIFQSLFENNILNEKLEGIQEIITTSVGIVASIFFILRIPYHIGKEIIMRFNLGSIIQQENIHIDDILVDFGFFSNHQIFKLLQTLLRKFIHKDDISLKEFHEQFKIKLTVKVYNVTQKQLEYISYETDPELSILTLSQMTTAIPFFFKPIKYKECLYVDGGLRGHFPIEVCQSENYLGIFIRGGSYPENSEFIQLFPIVDFIYSLMINQDQIVYDIQQKKINERIIYIEVDYGLNFNMPLEDKSKIIELAYKETTKHFKKYLEKDIV